MQAAEGEGHIKPSRTPPSPHSLPGACALHSYKVVASRCRTVCGLVRRRGSRRSASGRVEGRNRFLRGRRCLAH